MTRKDGGELREHGLEALRPVLVAAGYRGEPEALYAALEDRPELRPPLRAWCSQMALCLTRDGPWPVAVEFVETVMENGGTLCLVWNVRLEPILEILAALDRRDAARSAASEALK